MSATNCPKCFSDGLHEWGDVGVTFAIEPAYYKCGDCATRFVTFDNPDPTGSPLVFVVLADMEKGATE